MLNKFLVFVFCLFSSIHAISVIESITIESSPGGKCALFIDKDLEAKPETTGKKVLEAFLAKNGTFHIIKPFDEEYEGEKIKILPGDAVYAACTGGFCRSQTLWAMLLTHKQSIILFPPHATRLGFDPYNGGVNWHKNDAKEEWPDSYNDYFKHPKAVRFGYSEFAKYKHLHEGEVSKDILKEIEDFYLQNYFGSDSAWEGQKGKRRVYVAFAANAHVIMNRLNQSNADLSNVVVYYIESPDYISSPPADWGLKSRSFEAYEKYAGILEEILDVSSL